MTILAHEIWHCGMSHFMREHGRIEDHEMWNHAIDHEVNSLLEEMMAFLFLAVPFSTDPTKENPQRLCSN